MTDTTKTPLEVSENTAPVAAGLRYLIAMLGTFAVARGWVDAENVDGVVTAIITIGTVLYGLWRTYKTKKALVITAEAAPNSIAKVV